MAKKLLRLPTVKKRTGLGKSSIYAMMAAGEFPKNIKLSARAVGWDDDKIDAWIESRINASIENKSANRSD